MEAVGGGTLRALGDLLENKQRKKVPPPSFPQVASQECEKGLGVEWGGANAMAPWRVSGGFALKSLFPTKSSSCLPGKKGSKEDADLGAGDEEFQGAETDCRGRCSPRHSCLLSSPGRRLCPGVPPSVKFR